MSTENALQELLNDAAKKIAHKHREKPQQLNGQYRNRMWYRHLFKGKSMDEASDLVAANLKKQTFAHERECAEDVYYEVYGTKFQTRAERTMATIEAENAALKAKLAELEAVKIPETVKDDGKTIDFSEFPDGMDKEAFKVFFYEWFEKSQGKQPAPVVFGKAWKNYNKENEVEKV
jgi:hypothetical protein